MKKDGVLKMVTVDEIRRILKEEYGIENEKQLEKAIKEKGGVNIEIFTKKKEAQVMAS